ncbi:bacterial alpha-L-rhamnosidase-domain-containing protein [Plectosphaerella plurivora]|uniref:alpha-L-rhamnosidase n=1 Tax=Plectosphaerella plurivora TaxID=936078 RepID=A0A9P8VJH0_9PEZI|nr:bacterial alpha-L-rhamnosidase-domain-containing protein [Plectosphaerella plurivora]
MPELTITHVHFEHYAPGAALGVDETRPRISWRFGNAPNGFCQDRYEIRLSKVVNGEETEPAIFETTSSESHLVPWPAADPVSSRERWAVRVRARGTGSTDFTPWSKPEYYEAGLLSRDDWSANLISAPWAAADPNTSKPEDLFRKDFSITGKIRSARLYITSHGVYEAEINGRRVGDFFLAPGWASYDGRLPYQTYDVTEHLTAGTNAIGVRVAEGWFNGRLGFHGGRRNIWGDRTALFAQLQVTLADGSQVNIATDNEWNVRQGPIRLAEIYDGEKYDANAEIPGWSSHGLDSKDWSTVEVLPAISADVQLARGSAESVRRIETLQPIETITTPSGKTILDFGQNLVGYIRIKNVSGPAGHTLTLSHAEVLENGELGIRPLRVCKAQDTYTLRGDSAGETYEPRFTFHGFRYVQVDDWPSSAADVSTSLEAVVCHTDMEERGTFSCSEAKINSLFSNVRWGMRGNFLSVPTDCPQRDERLGWTGDLALFAPTAAFVYGCHGILRDWLKDVWFDQKKQGGIPPVVSPNALAGAGPFGHPMPFAIWADVTVLAPWTLWEETRDPAVLEAQYESMETWLEVIPRNEEVSTSLWKFSNIQLGDWLDPNAPPAEPQKATTDPVLVSNAFLINSLDHMVRIAGVLGKEDDVARYSKWAADARADFTAEYTTANGRLMSDTQTAYALAICFDLVSPAHRERAAERLVDIVRRNTFRVGTGFAGTPFICEALTLVGHSDVAYSMLLNEACPSWLYPITMGATTMWERWDSMLPDGSINPGEMTSFNHYAYGAVAKFMVERLAGLKRTAPGWTKAEVRPEVEGPFTWAKAEHVTPYGKVSSSWVLEEGVLKIDVVVPPTTEMEVVIPGADGPRTEVVGAGSWSFSTPYERKKSWPVKAIGIFD